MSTLKVDGIRSNSASSDAITLASDGTCSANISSVSGGQIGGRNMIINGDMQCNQRGDQTGISGPEYTLDRWKLGVTNLGAYSVSQLTNSDNLINTGHRFSAKVDCTTADASPAAGDLVLLQTRLEGLVTNRLCWGTSNAKKAVLSFWAKADINGWSSGTKDFVVEIQASDSQEFSAVCQLATAGTWQKFTVPIDAKTSGTIAHDHTESMGINWWLDAGSHFKGGTGVTGWAAKGNSGGVRVAEQTLALGAHTDNNFYLTGVQFELNDTGVATDFEHRSYGQELELCRRYYQLILDRAREGEDDSGIAGTPYSSSSGLYVPVRFHPIMRTKPTVESSSTTDGFRSRHGDLDAFDSFSGFNTATRGGGTLIASADTGKTVGHYYWIETNTSSGKLAVSAEL